MRAYATDGFGQPASIRELPDPVPGEGEVLVRVKAAALSTTDIAVMAGYMKDYLPHLFPLVTGIDAAGVVDSVGAGVEGFKEGDEVFGFQRRPVMGAGTHAELSSMAASGLAPRPAELSREQASIICHSALTAAAAVDAAALKPGDRVVLLGATGGVGSFATQLAAAGGAPAIAVTRGDYADYARSLGAADVIDYTAGDAVAAIGERFPDGIDALIDLAGVPELGYGLAMHVHSGGRVISVVLPPDVEGLAARGVEGILATRYSGEHRFAELTAKIVAGEMKLPHIQTFAFDDIVAGFELQATRHVHGKLTVVMA